MSLEFRNLQAIGNHISVHLQADEHGYIGRECPVLECESYFLVKPGTGLIGDNLPCHCPYCGHSAGADQFYTKKQIEYAQSVAVRQFADAMVRDLKQMEFTHPAKGSFGLGISMKLEPGTPTPIRYYREKALETFVTCSTCTLDYGVYGVFGHCPDCGIHNSLQMLERNIDLTRRQVDLAQTLNDAALRRHLLEDALENCVSALDGFGREAVRVRAERSRSPAKSAGVSFQNLDKATKAVKQLFGADLQATVSPEIWDTAHRGFMKRHVIAHRSGVADQSYAGQTGDTSAVVGRKVTLTAQEILAVADAVLEIGRALIVALP
jgi:hypothetical protein